MDRKLRIEEQADDCLLYAGHANVLNILKVMLTFDSRIWFSCNCITLELCQYYNNVSCTVQFDKLYLLKSAVFKCYPHLQNRPTLRSLNENGPGIQLINPFDTYANESGCRHTIYCNSLFSRLAGPDLCFSFCRFFSKQIIIVRMFKTLQHYFTDLKQTFTTVNLQTLT